MNITVIYVGGAKDGYISEGCAEFEKRIGAYAKLSQIELKEFRVGDESSAASRRLADNRGSAEEKPQDSALRRGQADELARLCREDRTHERRGLFAYSFHHRRSFRAG